MQGVAIELFSRKAAGVATNVPGPQQPLYLAGCTLREMLFWVLRTGTNGIGMFVIRDYGRVHFWLDRCKTRSRSGSAEPQVRAEFEKLLYLTLMGKWACMLDFVAVEALIPAAA